MSEESVTSGIALYEQARGFVPRQVAGETLLVPVSTRTTAPASRSAELFVLNRTGSLLWEMLKVPRTTEDLAQALYSEYDLGIEDARSDVEAYLRALLAVGATRQVGIADA
jgi:hypothetical protein